MKLCALPSFVCGIVVLSCCIVIASSSSSDSSSPNAPINNYKEIWQLLQYQQQQQQGKPSNNSEKRNQNKLPTQPIHKSILAHRKRTILRSNNKSNNSNNGNDDSMDDNDDSSEIRMESSSLLRRGMNDADARRTLLDNSDKIDNLNSIAGQQQQTSAPSSNQRQSSQLGDESDQQQSTQQQQQEEEEPPPPLLQSPWWVKITEEYGSNSFNFIPASRRAASSVVFTHRYRKTIEGDNDAAGSGSGGSASSSSSNADSGNTNNNNEKNSEEDSGPDNGGDDRGLSELSSTKGEDASPGETNAADSSIDGEDVVLNINNNATTTSNVTDLGENGESGVLVESVNNSSTGTNSISVNLTSEVDGSDNTTSATIIGKEDGDAIVNESGQEASLSASSQQTQQQQTQQQSNTNMKKEDPKEKEEQEEDDEYEEEEYMIISGGYTDHDWKTFPVYAFPITSSVRTGSGQWIDLSPTFSDLHQEPYYDTSNNNNNNNNDSENSDHDDDGNRKSNDSWCKSEDGLLARDRLHQEAKYLVDDDDTNHDPWEHASQCPPEGRMGHSSVIYNNKLYVFGGLIYDEEQAPGGGGRGKRESFRLEDVPYVYRLDLQEMFDLRREAQERGKGDDGDGDGDGRRSMEEVKRDVEMEDIFGDDKDNVMEELTSMERDAIPFLDSMETNILEGLSSNSSSRYLPDTPPTSTHKITGWQRIIPRVKSFPISNELRTSAAASEILLKSVNRGEMQGGLWSSDTPGEHAKFVMYGGLRIAAVDYDGTGPLAPTNVVKGSPHSSSTYGGSSHMPSHRVLELPLGDIWAYDLVLDAWEKITNDFGLGVPILDDGDLGPEFEDEEHAEVRNKTYIDMNASSNNDDFWWAELDANLYPRARTAHAATIVGNELVLHGGMGMSGINEWDGSTDWEALDDMWIFDLTTRQWKRRFLFPLLVRSYHNLLGWSVDERLTGWGKDFENFTSWEGPVVAAFGGYTTGVDVFSGEVSTICCIQTMHKGRFQFCANHSLNFLYSFRTFSNCRRWLMCLMICSFRIHLLLVPMKWNPPHFGSKSTGRLVLTTLK